MSLIDALLTEGYRDPRDVWIALRTDGIRGCGSPADPYDGGIRQALPIPSTTGAGWPGLTLDIKQVIVVTDGPHGYATNDEVAITGVTEGAFLSTVFNVQKTITVINASTFLLTLDSTPTVQPGNREVNFSQRISSPGGEPIGARLFWPVAKITTAVNHDYVDFDVVTIAGVSNNDFNGTFAIMGATPGPSGASNVFYYRLSKMPPGTFTETGLVTCSKRICRFDEVMRALPNNAIVRLGPGEFETRGFCALYLQDPPGGGKIGYELKPGTRLLGSGIGATTLKLVYAIDYRSSAAVVGNLQDTISCEVSDFTADANIAGQPVPAGAAFASVSCGAVVLVGRHVRIFRVRAVGFATQSGPEGFVIATVPHSADPAGSQHSVIEDCIAERPGENNTHETALIQVFGHHFPPDARAGVVRNCYANCEFAGGKPNEYVGIASILQPGAVPGDAPDQFRVVTRRAHQRGAGNNVVLNGVLTPVPQPDGTVVLAFHPHFSDLILGQRSFEIVGLGQPPETELICRMINPPATQDQKPIDVSQAYTGVQFHGVAAPLGMGGVAEGNSAYSISIPFYVDTGVTWSQIQRNNYYSNVLYGAYQNFGADGAAEAGRELTSGSLTRVAGDLSLAKFTLPFPHGFRVGLAIRVTLVRVGQQAAPFNTYNGTFVVEQIEGDSTFYYRMKSEPTSDADAPTPNNPPRIQTLWQTSYYMIENNLIDLDRTNGGTPLVPCGLNTFGYAGPPPYVFPQLVIRENIVRHVDHLASTPTMQGQNTLGFNLSSVANAIVEQNVIDVEHPYPIRHVWSNNMKSFNNRTAAGTLVRGKEDAAASPDAELQDLIEDVAMLCL